MDSDSLDWIWEDFVSPGVTDLRVADHAADDDDDGGGGSADNDGGGDNDRGDRFHFDGDDDGDQSAATDSSESSVGSAFMMGDERTVRELNEIVDDINRRCREKYVVAEEDEAKADSEENGEPAADVFYIDALEAAENLLSEVQLMWTDTLYQNAVNGKNQPESYKKTTNIEKLVLLYASNFIEQFKMKHPNRRQLVLIHENECGIQKCICTTIKPSRLVYHDLNDLTGYSEFVAKHITYNKLEDPEIVPKKIVSPATTLETQNANCFELATLLVSFLIGCGYNAFVVFGYATENVCNNDLTHVKLDFLKENFNNEQKPEFVNLQDDNDDIYAVKPMFDSCSEYVQFLMEEEKNITVVDSEVKENDLNDHSLDPLYGKRIHCWVIIIPSETKDQYTTSEPYFIEPSTSEQKDTANENYIGIEAIWNQKNFWVNLQALEGGCSQYDFTLMNIKCWEHFLPNESESSQNGTLGTRGNENEISKHLVMPNSWVNVLEVPRNRYLLLYPNGRKIVPYMNALLEYYADYVVPDGLIGRTTFYAEPEYASKQFVTEIYKHRVDNLVCIEKTYTNDLVKTVEYFSSGRKDCLKTHKYCGVCNSIQTERLVTYYNLRLDSMIELKIDADSFIVKFNDRSDLLFWRLCTFQQVKKDEDSILNVKRKPKNIVEKYLRDESKDKDRDIASRHFNFVSNRIFVQYQYGPGQITQSSRLFEMTSVTSSDQFDPLSVVEDIVYPYTGHLKPYEAYAMLQEMMKAEHKAVHDVSKLEDDVIQMLETRSREQSEFKLKIDLLDWDRNHKIRKLIKNEKNKKLALANREKAMQLDHALPYYEMAKRPFTHDNALKVRDKIVADFRRNTKKQFVQAKNMFKKNHFKMQSMMHTLENNDLLEPETRNEMIALCWSWKNKLDTLMLKMERYQETRIKRYNNLASYLNGNPNFEMLPPLKLFTTSV